MSAEIYSVSVEPLGENEGNVQGNVAIWKIYREAAEKEYEYVHSSSNKLDNKVYILLAVCAFLFPVLYSVRIQACNFMLSWPPFMLVLVKFLPLICLSVAIVLLLCILRAVKVARVDVFSAIQDKNPDDDSLIEVEKRLTWLYASIRNTEMTQHERKYKIANTAMVLIIIAVLLTVLAVANQEYFGLHEGGEKIMRMNGSAVSKEEATKMTYDEMIDYVVRTGNPMPRIPTMDDFKKSKYVCILGESRDI